MVLDGWKRKTRLKWFLLAGKALFSLLAVAMVLVVCALVYLLIQDFLYDEKKDSFNENGKLIESTVNFTHMVR